METYKGERSRRYQYQGFDDAVRDSSTSLTLVALRGKQKQSVQDAERMLSFVVAKFLREHGYEVEGRYVEIVAWWHEAADGRGITQLLEHCRKNYSMLNMILDEWMPWHTELYDFSTIDINRYLCFGFKYKLSLADCHLHLKHKHLYIFLIF